MKLAICTLDGKGYTIEQLRTIDVPKGATYFHYRCTDKNGFEILHGKSFTLPGVKVKKRQFVVPTCKEQPSDVVTSITQHRTEDDIRREYPGITWYHKITETEIEEEY